MPKRYIRSEVRMMRLLKKHREAETSDGFSRRQFLKYFAGGAAGVTAASLIPGVGISSILDSGSGATALKGLDSADFAQRLGETFKLHKGAFDTLDLSLIEVKSGDTNDPALKESFSLLFKGPAGSEVEQGTYDIKNQAMGKFPLFIVPMKNDKGDSNYEAVFARV